VKINIRRCIYKMDEFDIREGGTRHRIMFQVKEVEEE